MGRLFSFSVLVFSLFLVASLVSPSSYAGLITYHCSGGSHVHDHTADSNTQSSFQTSLMGVFSDLVSASSISKSHSSTGRGSGAGKILASFYCRRGTQGCKRCVESTTISISNLCHDHQNAVVWYTECTLQYATTHDITLPNKEDQETPWAWWHSHSRIDEITNQSQFIDALSSITESLIDKATNWGSIPQFYATGEVLVTILDTLYATVECSPVKGPAACRDCLLLAVARAASCCGGSRAAEVLLPGCRLGYDLGPSLLLAHMVGPFSSSSASIGSRSIAYSEKK